MITINIDDTSIKVMAINRGKIKVAVMSHLEPGMVEDGLIVNKAAVSEQIKKLWDMYDITEKKVIAAVTGLHSVYRWVKIPKLPKPLIAEAAKRELLRVLPVLSIDEIYLSWQAVSISDKDIILCFAGIPRNTVDALMDTLHEAGLECSNMDIKPLAIARVADARDAIAVDIQPTCFDIAVVVNGIPELIRSLSFSERDIAESEKIKTILDEIERTVGFYNSSHKDNPITSGISAYISGDYKESLIDRLDYNVRPFPAMLSAPGEFNIGDYIVNVGLALKSVKVTASQLRVNINFIPERYLPKPFPTVAVVSWLFVIVAIIIIILGVLRTGHALNETAALEESVNKARAQLEAVEVQKTDTQKLQETLQATENALISAKLPIENYAKNREAVITGLSDVTSKLSGYIILDSISYQRGSDSGKLVIQGYAPDEATILGYMDELNSTKRYVQVAIIKMQVVEYNKVTFSLTLIPKTDE